MNRNMPIAIIAVIAAVVVCAAAYVVMNDDDGGVEGNSDRKMDMMDRLLVVEAPGNGTASVELLYGGNDPYGTVTINVQHIERQELMYDELWNLDMDVSVDPHGLKLASITIEALPDEGETPSRGTMSIVDGYDTVDSVTVPVGNEGGTVRLDTDCSLRFYRVVMDGTGLNIGEGLTFDEGQFEVRTDQGQFPLRIAVTVVFEDTDGDNLTLTGGLDIWLSSAPGSS